MIKQENSEPGSSELIYYQGKLLLRELLNIKELLKDSK